MKSAASRTTGRFSTYTTCPVPGRICGLPTRRTKTAPTTSTSRPRTRACSPCVAGRAPDALADPVDEACRQHLERRDGDGKDGRAEEVELAVGQPTRQVAAPVEPLPRRAEGRRHEALGGQLGAVAQALAEVPELGFVGIMLGRSDILAITMVRNTEHLASFVHNQISSIPGVRRTESTLGVNFIKHDYRMARIVAQ